MRLVALVALAPILTAQAVTGVPGVAALGVPEKVGQLMVHAVRPGETGPGTEAWAKLRRDVERHHVGGVHVFRARAEETVSLVNRVQSVARVPVLITADFEGGTGYIVRGGTRFPRGMGLAATGDTKLARRVAEAVAREGRTVGVHVNFFPVMDVNNNPRNPIINLRSFGDRPDQVARFGAAYVAGLQAGGMLGTAKHFPGHGDTETDSHLALPVVQADRSRLDAVELPPFKAAIDAGVACVMSAHIAWPKVTGETALPATLSSKILIDLLRGEMGFRGICYTDALDMEGITRLFGPEEASIRAVLAGADALLFTQDVPRISAALVKAVEDRRIPMARLDEACGRILAAKRRLGLARAAKAKVFPADPARRFHDSALQAEAIMRSLTVIRDEPSRLPIRLTTDSRLLHVSLRDPGQDWSWDDPVPAIRQRLAATGAHLSHADLDDDVAVRNRLDVVLDHADAFDVIVVSAVAGLAANRGRTGLSQAQSRALHALAETGAVLVLLGNPYGFPEPKGFGTVLLGYDYDAAHGRLAVSALLGDFKPAGRLPVDVPGIGKRGDGR